MDNNSMDKLFESALSKDKAKLPEQPSKPNAALLAKLSSSPAAVVTASAVTTTAGIGIWKLSSILLGVVTFGTAAFFYFRSPAPSTESQQPISPAMNNTVVLPVTDSQTRTTVVINKKFSEDSVRNKKRQDSISGITTMPSSKSPEDNMILPSNPPKTYPTDSTRVQLRHKGK